MDRIHALYSKTRNVIYLNDSPHTDFWSLYLRDKYPQDKWVITDTESIDYLDIIRDEKRLTRKTFCLYDTTDILARKLYMKIMETRDRMAIEVIRSKQSGERDQFLVFKSSRGEAVVLYLGFDVDDALNVYNSTSGAETVEVWRNGKFADSIYNKSEYLDKVNKRKTS